MVLGFEGLGFQDVHCSQLAMDRVCVFEVVPARFLSRTWEISHES